MVRWASFPAWLELDAEYRCCQLPTLHYVGPMLRSQYWESTAVPELRKRLMLLAQARPTAGVQGSYAEHDS
jgi:hypothetical protein